MDTDLDGMPRDQLIAEVKKLRAGIREHRDTTGHNLCWHHPGTLGPAARRRRTPCLR